MRRVPSRYRNASIVRERDHGALKRFAFLLVCGLVLAGGFVYAGGQHFGALQLGYQTEKLRNALTEAREEQRRLTVEKEIAASPARLERAARRLGMQPMQPAQIDPLKHRTETHELKVSLNPRTAANTPREQKTQQPRAENNTAR
jgi:cell division protein FtsL